MQIRAALNQQTAIQFRQYAEQQFPNNLEQVSFFLSNKTVIYWMICLQGFCHTLKTWNFVIYFSRLGKCLEIVQKVGKSWNFNSKPGKNPENCKFNISKFTFQNIIYQKMSI